MNLRLWIMQMINVSEIPSVEAMNLGSTFLNAVKKFYEDPNNLRAFEVWRKNKEQYKEVQHHGSNFNHQCPGSC